MGCQVYHSNPRLNTRLLLCCEQEVGVMQASNRAGCLVVATDDRGWVRKRRAEEGKERYRMVQRGRLEEGEGEDPRSKEDGARRSLA